MKYGMGIYYMIINESKKEYVYFEKNNLNTSSFFSTTHNLFLSYVMQFSAWKGENIKMINDTDTDTEDYFYEIRDNWKNREDDFISDYKDYLLDIIPDNSIICN